MKRRFVCEMLRDKLGVVQTLNRLTRHILELSNVEVEALFQILGELVFCSRRGKTQVKSVRTGLRSAKQYNSWCWSKSLVEEQDY